MSEGRLHGQRILDCIRAALDHPAIDEVVIVDDGSDDFEQLDKHLLRNCGGNLRLIRNKENLGVFGNKIVAVAQCSGDWVITCDSDNVQDKAYIDRVVQLIAGYEERVKMTVPTHFLVNVFCLPAEPSTWLCPSFAKTHFDYRELIGLYDLAGLARILREPMFQCECNTGNQTVHRESFMRVFEKYRGQRADLLYPNWLNLTPEQRPVKYWRLVFDALDSFILNMTWLLAGNRVHIVEGLEYEHYWSGGDESNYARSPKEKDDLGAILFKELEAKCLAAQAK